MPPPAPHNTAPASGAAPATPRQKLMEIPLRVRVLLLSVGGLILIAMVWAAVEQFQPAAALTWTLLLLGMPGALGGLAYGIKDGDLHVPGWSPDDWRCRPGVLADLVFGLLGGFAVFLIVPGDFKLSGIVSNQTPIDDLVKVIGLAAVGGYGGRALIEKVLSKQISEMQRELETMTSRQQESEFERENDANAVALVRRHLEPGLDAGPINVVELKQAVRRSSPRAQVEIFYLARNARKREAGTT